MTTLATNSFYLRRGKRGFDALCAAAGIVLLAPVLIGLALAVLLTSGWPILFLQERTGLRGCRFSIWKFRTMARSDEPNHALVTASGDPRVTPFGKWLRRTKADELPQLFNVLFGHMSLVGPRPEVPFYTANYSPLQREVLRVRPGVTGPTANHYISEEELLARAPDKEYFYVSVLLPAKLESDLRYIQSIAFNTDLKLIANTVVSLMFKSSHRRKLAARPSEREA